MIYLEMAKEALDTHLGDPREQALAAGAQEICVVIEYENGDVGCMRCDPHTFSVPRWVWDAIYCEEGHIELDEDDDDRGSGDPKWRRLVFGPVKESSRG